MKKELIKKRILKVISGMKIVSLATIKDKRPWVRFAVSHNDGLNLYISTYASSRKVKQINKNSNVHIAIMANSDNIESSFVQIVGRAKVRYDSKIKHKLWQNYMKKYYSGCDDPEYVVIEIKPQLIEYSDKETEAPLVYKVR